MSLTQYSKASRIFSWCLNCALEGNGKFLALKNKVIISSFKDSVNSTIGSLRINDGSQNDRPQNNNIIGLKRKNTRAARAIHILSHIFAVLW